MPSKVPITTDELSVHLDEQLSFLEGSADSFDRGFEAEAKRIAVTLRILLHDRGNSKSLLGQLGIKDHTFISTALPFNPNNVLAHSGLISIALGPPKTRYVAMLDEVPVRAEKPFVDWWGETVFVDDERRPMTREQLVLTMANQDGGAHVDPRLDAQYHALTKGTSLKWVASDGAGFSPMQDPARAAVRQIAHEVLASLKPGYSRKPKHAAGGIVGGMSITVSPQYGKVSRNARCPCGSGKKYKHCHGHHSANP